MEERVVKVKGESPPNSLLGIFSFFWGIETVSQHSHTIPSPYKLLPCEGTTHKLVASLAQARSEEWWGNIGELRRKQGQPSSPTSFRVLLGGMELFHYTLISHNNFLVIIAIVCWNHSEIGLYLSSSKNWGPNCGRRMVSWGWSKANHQHPSLFLAWWRFENGITTLSYNHNTLHAEYVS